MQELRSKPQHPSFEIRLQVVLPKTKLPYSDAYDVKSVYLLQSDETECDVNTIRTLNIVSTVLSSVQNMSPHQFMCKQVASFRGIQVLLFAEELK
jgi:hypothetical protein